MSEAMNRRAVEVDQLRKGMYVAEPDRPWTDLPFPLQGFTIQSDEELRILRQYCSYVYVDEERSEALVEEPDPASTASSTAPDRAEVSKRAVTARPDAEDGLDESRRYPDPDRLRPQVKAAARALISARRFLDEAFDSAHRGQGVDLPAARSTIADLIARLTKHPTATLLLSSLNARDNFTSTHSINVCVLALSFCLRAGLDKRRLEVIGFGSLLHDVGKVYLPAELVNRAGPLTEDEWELVKRHPSDGYRILRDSGKVPRSALEITSMHHERRDGRGYPRGLARNDLPNYVLVAALINRYHALTSPRPYRGAQAPDRVLQSFYNDADNLYGSRTVEAFIRCVGIYPMGSLVELDSGALGVIVSSRPTTRLRPTVQLVRTPDGEPYQKMVLLNLAAEAERRERADEPIPVRRVRRVRSPAQTGIDPGAVIAESFGVDIA